MSEEVENYVGHKSSDSYTLSNSKDPKDAGETCMREKYTIALLAAKLVFLTQVPKHRHNSTTEFIEHHPPQPKLKGLANFSDALASVAVWTFDVHFGGGVAAKQ
jgi:hypothetical protein